YNVGATPDSVVVRDLNGDGKPDLAVLSENSIAATAGYVSVLLGNGDGTFQAAGTFSVGLLPLGVTTGDVNGDGKADLVTVNHNSNSVSVLLGNGDGSFQAAQSFPAGGVDTSPNAVAVGDFNGDGRLDLVTANYSVSVLLNQPGTTTVVSG